MQRADVIVLGAPCYNGGIPWALKAFVDTAWRAGITVTTKRLPANRPCRAHSAVIVTSYGGLGLDAEGIDIHRRTLMYCMHRIGVANTAFVDLRGTEMPGFVLDAGLLKQVIRNTVSGLLTPSFP